MSGAVLSGFNTDRKIQLRHTAPLELRFPAVFIVLWLKSNGCFPLFCILIPNKGFSLDWWCRLLLPGRVELICNLNRFFAWSLLKICGNICKLTAHTVTFHCFDFIRQQGVSFENKIAIFVQLQCTWTIRSWKWGYV